MQILRRTIAAAAVAAMMMVGALPASADHQDTLRWEGQITQHDSYDTPTAGTWDRYLTYSTIGDEWEGTTDHDADVEYVLSAASPPGCPSWSMTGSGDSTGRLKIYYASGQWWIQGISDQNGTATTTTISSPCDGPTNTVTQEATCCIHLDTPWVHQAIPTGETDPHAQTISGTYLAYANPDSPYEYTFEFTRAGLGNHPPVAVDDQWPVRTLPGTPHDLLITHIPVMINDYDPDGDPIELVSASASAGDAIATDGGTVFLRAVPGVLLAAGCPEVITIKYVIADPYGATDTGTAHVQVSYSPFVVPHTKFAMCGLSQG